MVFLCPNIDLSVRMQTAARASLLPLQVRAFLIKKTRFSGKIEGPKQLLESSGEGSQPAGTIPTLSVEFEVKIHIK